MKALLGFISFLWVLQSCAMEITYPVTGTLWNSTGPRAIEWIRNSTDPEVFEIFLTQVEGPIVLLNGGVDSSYTEYIFDDVLPTGDNYYITFYNNNHDYIVTSGLFTIVPGGPYPEISVTVIEGQISTVGGGLFSAPYGEPTPTFFPPLTLTSVPTSIVTSMPSSVPVTIHDTGSNISKSATVGIGVAVAVVVIILIFAVGYYLWAKRRGPQMEKLTDSLPLRKYPASKNLEPQESEVVDGPRVEIWGA